MRTFLLLPLWLLLTLRLLVPVETQAELSDLRLQRSQLELFRIVLRYQARPKGMLQVFLWRKALEYLEREIDAIDRLIELGVVYLGTLP